MRLGFVGAGRIGRPMVQRLSAAGHTVQVLTRSEAARAALEAAAAPPTAAQAGSATAVDTLRQVAAGAEVVFVCVHTDEQVREVGPRLVAAMAKDAVLVVHTTGSPATADALAEHGVEVVDAPVSGGPHDVAAGHITLLVGGSDTAVERVRPALQTYGDPILHVGPRGNGQRVKLINNALFAANIGLLAAAVDLGVQLGIEQKALLEALPQGSSNSFALAGVARAGSVENFAHAAGEFIGKDVAVVRRVVAELGGDLGALADAHRALAELIPAHAHALA
ncbi:NAD(P)-dependent oxidoreductase [Cryptosporangium sp. NPDC048952]|uniref:NAD(P)-dependent oxidoreductase n=1 Tax=Cryptosporangium sp. NPDC048952 TaxID=3363961 RepID=UPI003711F17B